MPITVDIDVMLAKRKMSVGELAERIGITPANLAVLRNGRTGLQRIERGLHRPTPPSPGPAAGATEGSNMPSTHHLPPGQPAEAAALYPASSRTTRRRRSARGDPSAHLSITFLRPGAFPVVPACSRSQARMSPSVWELVMQPGEVCNWNPPHRIAFR
jgi:hypothetical protein